jgi:hypothetical protein
MIAIQALAALPGVGAQERRAASLLHDELCRSRVGQRWERLLRTNGAEIEALLAVHPDVRERASVALEGLAGCVHAPTLDEGALAATSCVLSDLERLGTIELRRAVGILRDELADGHGRSMAQLLAD